jgi:hypothetical protein
MLNEVDLLIKDIDELRQNLYNLINKNKENLLDSDVQAASLILNAAINKYNKIIKDKIRAE